jgi:hypothetical protein
MYHAILDNKNGVYGMRLTMRQIKQDAAKRRAALLKELVDNDYTITELAIKHGMTQQAMGVMIRKARIDAVASRVVE